VAPQRQAGAGAAPPERQGGGAAAAGPERLGGADRAGGAGAGGGPGRGGRGGGAGRAAPIALAFSRSDAFARLAGALPENDPRVPVFRRLAVIHADIGARALADPAALDAPWLGAYGIRVLSPSK